LENTVAYFGSRVLYPNRPLEGEDKSEEVTAALYRQSLKSALRGDFDSVARELGYQLGNDLYSDYLAGKFSSSAFRRFLGKLRPQSHLSEQNDSYRGWGWTPRTSSWVEPTAFALMALREAPAQQLPKNVSERRDLAVALLYDRMCPGGGWNCGNPRVYGVDGDALVLPTCWALLALGIPEKDAQEKPGRALSLAWLQKEFPKIESAASLAVARMTLENYGIEPPQAKRDLQDWTTQDLAGQGTHVLAWACMALNPARRWPAVAINNAKGGPDESA